MYIIKVGGGRNINLEGVASDLAVLEEPFLVVLGANALRDQLGQRLGQEKVQLTSVSGYSSVFSVTNCNRSAGHQHTEQFAIKHCLVLNVAKRIFTKDHVVRRR